MITAEELDELVLAAARQRFRDQGLTLKQAELVKRATVMRQADGGVVVGIEKRRS